MTDPMRPIEPRQPLKCIDPSQVSETDHLTALWGEASPDFELHRQKCEYCQNEIQLYRTQDSQLQRQLTFIHSPARALCPEAQQLGDFLVGMLSTKEGQNVADHLNTCSYCSAELADLQAWWPETRIRPTAGKLQPSGELFPNVKPLKWLRRVLAITMQLGQATTQPQYALAGVRGSAEGLPMTFQAEEVSITLTIQPLTPSSKIHLVLGLVQRDNYPIDSTTGAEVRLYGDGTTLATERIDELGNFAFDAVTPTDFFDLELTLEDKIVLVQNLTLN